jgi:hypothetical protein
MTNILVLPQFSAGAFTIANNAAWLDSIYFGAPGSPLPFTIAGCSTTSGSNVVTVPVLIGTVGIGPGMQVSGTAQGFPPASYVGQVTSLTTFTLVDGFGSLVNAIATNVEITVTFNPAPLDLTGISFAAGLRVSAGSKQVFLPMQTGDGTLVNGGKLGTLGFNVSRVKMQSVPPGNYVMDVLATDGTVTVNLFQQAPATVTVLAGIADITTLTGAKIG